MESTYHNILIAVDGSKPADLAFDKGLAMAKRNNANLSLVHVVDTSNYRGIQMYDINFVKKALKNGEVLLNEYAEKAKKFGIENVKTIVEDGSPKVAITKHAAKVTNADLIICGATGIDAIERIFLGSVSEHIVRRAKCDVLVVRIEQEVKDS